MFTKADSRVFPFRMTAISTFSAGTSNATHSVPNWSRAQRNGFGGLCSVGFSRVNLCHDCCPHGRWPVRPTGFAVSTKSSATRSSMRFAGRSGVAVRLDAKIGWSRSPVAWTSNPHSGHADARKRSPYQAINERKSPDPFSSLTPFLRRCFLEPATDTYGRLYQLQAFRFGNARQYWNLSRRQSMNDMQVDANGISRFIKLSCVASILSEEKGSGLFTARLKVAKLCGCPVPNAPMRRMRSTMP